VLIVPLLYRERTGNERSIRQLVTGLTLLIALLQAVSYSQIIARWFFGDETPAYAIWLVGLVLVAGALVCMWIADRISAQGLMDGRILLMCMALFSGFPGALVKEVSAKLAAGQVLQLGVELGVWLLIVAGIIALTQAVRYFPLQQQASPEAGGLTNPNLRIRLNIVDDYPLGLANQFTVLLLLIVQHSVSMDTDTTPPDWLLTLTNPTSAAGMTMTFILVILATYAVVRTMLGSDQKPAAEHPWEASVLDAPEEQSYQKFYRQVFSRLRFPLALILAIISILPGIAVLVFDLAPAFGTYFGGFSLFLLLSLMTDFFSKVEQLAGESPSIVGRGTTPDLNLVYELEFDDEEE
jgi:preprotein translocase subunit SecY